MLFFSAKKPITLLWWAEGAGWTTKEPCHLFSESALSHFCKRHEHVFETWTNSVNAELYKLTLISFQCNWFQPVILFAKVLDRSTRPRTTITWHNVNIKILNKHKFCINLSNLYSCWPFEKIKSSCCLLQEFDNSNTELSALISKTWPTYKALS